MFGKQLSDKDRKMTEKANARSEYDIRYIKLHFTIVFTEDSTLPKYKTSALRGGMGEILLRENCIRDRKCETCDFESECIIRHTLYSKMEIQPAFMSAGDSVGYVLECEDYREFFQSGETMVFSLILFGKTIVHFSQFLNAFYALGKMGLGKEHSRFVIESVTNSEKEEIISGNDIDMTRYKIYTVSDYIEYRKKQINKKPLESRIKFQSPVTIKYGGKEQTQFQPKPFIESTARRVYILDCFEGIESNLNDRDYLESLPIPESICEQHRPISIRRYSNHQQTAMYLKGIEGELKLSGIPDELIELLLAGELIHIGKNTSFGFGRYRIF